MSHVLHSTPSSFHLDVIQSPVPVLVDFYAEWCGPCRMLSPTLERLATAFDGKARVVKIDIEQAPDLAREYRVQAVPTLLFVVDGEIVGRSEGVIAEPILTQALNRLVAAGSAV